MQPYIYHDPMFAVMHGKMTKYFTEIGFHSVSASIYAHDLIECWYEILLAQPVDDVNGVPLNIDMLPMGMEAKDVVDKEFYEVEQPWRDAIAQAWYFFRGDMFQHYVEVFLEEENPADSDLVMTLGEQIYLVPDDNLDDDDLVSMRLFRNLDRALAYGTN